MLVSVVPALLMRSQRPSGAAEPQDLETDEAARAVTAF